MNPNRIVFTVGILIVLIYTVAALLLIQCGAPTIVYEPAKLAVPMPQWTHYRWEPTGI